MKWTREIHKHMTRRVVSMSSGALELWTAGADVSEQASEKMSAVKHGSEASSAERTIERAV